MACGEKIAARLPLDGGRSARANPFEAPHDTGRSAPFPRAPRAPEIPAAPHGHWIRTEKVPKRATEARRARNDPLKGHCVRRRESATSQAAFRRARASEAL